MAILRDDFTKPTRDKIAQLVGYRCSNPDCRVPTIGATSTGDKVLNVGIACHITAAAPGGPRYDASMTEAERKSHTNGLWLCAKDSKVIDTDLQKYTTPLLRKWQAEAALRSFEAITTGTVAVAAVQAPPVTLASIVGASSADLAIYKRMVAFPAHPLELTLRLFDKDGGKSFQATKLAEAIDTHDELVVVAPPGMGKTTTLLQLAEAVNGLNKQAALYVRLDDWSQQSLSFLPFLLTRSAYSVLDADSLKQAATGGALCLMLDGWNELDDDARKRAASAVRNLRAEFPTMGFVLSTRRQALQVPLQSPIRVEIDLLSDDQQTELARALRGDEGAALVDAAWRTPGLRDLIAIPLYLTVLLRNVTGPSLPQTKEEVLRLFAQEHEKISEHREMLRKQFGGYHERFLSQLASAATAASNTSISEDRARAIVSSESAILVADGQLTISIKPIDAIDCLVSYHSIVRAGGDAAALSFQHQQIQEWYASLEVEALIVKACDGDAAAQTRLIREVLNLPSWEEPILFAIERLSREAGDGPRRAAHAITLAMSVDPMLAAEMIYRSTDGTWALVADRVVDFARRWHASGYVDRAVGFMIRTGRPEFSSAVWPLVTHADSQIHLQALRAAPRFRTTVLGPKAAERLNELEPSLLEHVASEIASRSGIDGIDLSVNIALASKFDAVKVDVIQSLAFRNADRAVAEILKSSDDTVWDAIVDASFPETSSDPDIRARLGALAQKRLVRQRKPKEQLRAILRPAKFEKGLEQAVEDAVASPDFPAKDNDEYHLLDQVSEYYPEAVARGLLRRLESGLPTPYKAPDVLRQSKLSFDTGSICEIVLSPASEEWQARDRVPICGPITVGKLLDELVALDGKWRANNLHLDKPDQDRYARVKALISGARLSSLADAILSRTSNVDHAAISVYADVFAHHGDPHAENREELDGTRKDAMVALVEQWGRQLLGGASQDRGQMSHVANSIKRLGDPRLLDIAILLTEADLAGWHRDREEARSLRPGQRRNPNSYTVYGSQYADAFFAIGNDDAATFLKSKLRDTEFGVQAASTLLRLWKAQSGPDEDRFPFKQRPDFESARARRRNPQPLEHVPGFATAIYEAVEGLLTANEPAGIELAGQLLPFAILISGKPRDALSERMLALDVSRRAKLAILKSTMDVGGTVFAKDILAAVRDFVEQAKVNTWMLQQNRWELEELFALFANSDKPSAVTDAEALLPTGTAAPRSKLVSALGYADSVESEDLLFELIETAGPMGSSELVRAVEARGSTSSLIRLLKHAEDNPNNNVIGIHGFGLDRSIAHNIRQSAAARKQLYEYYQRSSSAIVKGFLERGISEVSDTEGVLLMVGEYIAANKHFDGILDRALRKAVIFERPTEEISGTFELLPGPSTELRKALFGVYVAGGAGAQLAKACLVSIDLLRDEYGSLLNETRHPDIESGQQWPLAF